MNDTVMSHAPCKVNKTIDCLSELHPRPCVKHILQFQSLPGLCLTQKSKLVTTSRNMTQVQLSGHLSNQRDGALDLSLGCTKVAAAEEVATWRCQ